MATTEESIEASIDGRAARRHGEPQNANPHPWGTPERRHWNWGWLVSEGRKRAARERVSGAKS